MVYELNDRRHFHGFSLLEVSMALLLVGVVISIGLPVARVYVEQSKHVEDKITMQQLGESLLGYALARGGFPDPAAGNVLSMSSIGMKTTNPYDMDIKYYVNTLLSQSATSQNFTTLCDSARSIVDGSIASTTPAICNDVTVGFSNCTDSTVMAFVIISPGKNRVMEHENNDGDQVFENPAKKPNASNDYDDVVVSFGLPAFVSECQRL